jgi:hypothetical protein
MADNYGIPPAMVYISWEVAHMRLDAIAIGTNPPEDVNAVIEVPIGGEPIKYEMDKAAGTLVVDRFLHTPMRYPGNYGFVPHTLSQDGDPIEVLVANTRPIFPGAVINVRPIGVLKMEDDSGIDEKIMTSIARWCATDGPCPIRAIRPSMRTTKNGRRNPARGCGKRRERHRSNGGTSNDGQATWGIRE